MRRARCLIRPKHMPDMEADRGFIRTIKGTGAFFSERAHCAVDHPFIRAVCNLQPLLDQVPWCHDGVIDRRCQGAGARGGHWSVICCVAPQRLLGHFVRCKVQRVRRPAFSTASSIQWIVACATRHGAGTVIGLTTPTMPPAKRGHAQAVRRCDHGWREGRTGNAQFQSTALLPTGCPRSLLDGSTNHRWGQQSDAPGAPGNGAHSPVQTGNALALDDGQQCAPHAGPVQVLSRLPERLHARLDGVHWIHGNVLRDARHGTRRHVLHTRCRETQDMSTASILLRVAPPEERCSTGGPGSLWCMALLRLH